MVDHGTASALAEACSVDISISAAALERHSGDVDAAAAELLASQSSTPLSVLLDMGYSRDAAETALRSCSGNLQEALTSLLDSTGSDMPSFDKAKQLGECAICQEELQLSDAAMRCAGRAGCHHYGHAACLARWVHRCRESQATPNCPICRGPLQLNQRQIREFLQASSCTDGGQASGGVRRRMPHEHTDLLRDMVNNVDDASEDWQEIDWCKVAGFAALAAGTVLAVGLLAGMLLKDRGNDRNGRRSRR